MSDTPRMCIFVRNEDSGEPAYYCGHTDDPKDLRRGIANIVLGEIQNIPDEEETLSLTVEIKNLTDAEIAALPDLG